jgi:arsenate reductase-like glutaredoxin family protein
MTLARDPESHTNGLYGRAVSLETLVVFTANGCPHSAALCADLRQRGVPFVEINLSEKPLEIERLRRLIWEHRLPVIVDHERVSIGFRNGSSTFAELGLD